MNTQKGVSGKEMGQRIKALRLSRGWSQVAASVQLNVSLRTLVALENSTRRFRPLTLARISMSIAALEKAA